VVTPCPGELGADASAAFVEGFRRRTGRAPTAAAAEVHDAAALVAAARGTVAAAASDPRGALRAALARASLADGACGAAAIGPDGELAREPTALEVQGEAFVIAP
jgi:ABC-type branched-subunit amino acid transport system substrate-binding protein